MTTTEFRYFWNFFSALRNFSFSANRSCYGNLRMVTSVFSFSSMPIIFVASFVFLKARCTYSSIVSANWMKLLNRSLWTTGLFYSVADMQAVCSLRLSEVNVEVTRSGHKLSGFLIQAGAMSHPLPMSSSAVMAFFPVLTGLLIPLTWVHCGTSFVPNISATRDRAFSAWLGSQIFLLLPVQSF